MNRATTESILSEWRYGATQAERLCTALLHIEGFESVDPQCPLGGPDGLKDVFCKRDGKSWIAAAYFPTTTKTYPEIQEKFSHDFGGVIKNGVDGLVFFTNQRISPTERATLLESASPRSGEIYHIERIRGVLDSPKGYGSRLEYLRIPMTEEEQLGFYSALNSDITRKFLEHERSLHNVNQKLDILLERTSSRAIDLTSQPSTLTNTSIGELDFPTSQLSVGKLLWLHRLLTDEDRLPYQNRGTLRSVQVWIGQPGVQPEGASYVPPNAHQIPALLSELITNWNGAYSALRVKNRDEKIQAIANFHHKFLSIHPFLDGNGRLARALLQQQALELLGRQVSAKFTEEPKYYYEALRKADAGNLSELIHLVEGSLE